MKLPLPVIIGYSLLTLLTAVYCVLLWYGAGLWWTFYTPSATSHIPLISRLFMAPLPLPIWWTMIHWQLAAIASLLICITWGLKSTHKQNSDTAHTLPIVMHTLWIFFAVCGHILGALIPLLGVGYTIG